MTVEVPPASSALPPAPEGCAPDDWPDDIVAEAVAELDWVERAAVMLGTPKAAEASQGAVWRKFAAAVQRRVDERNGIHVSAGHAPDPDDDEQRVRLAKWRASVEQKILAELAATTTKVNDSALNPKALRLARVLENTPEERNRLHGLVRDACISNGYYQRDPSGFEGTIASAFGKADLEGPAWPGDRDDFGSPVADFAPGEEPKHPEPNGATVPVAGEKAKGKPPSTRHIFSRTAEQIVDRKPEWAYEYEGRGRMMRSTLALFAGRPDAGKSTAARYFAAGYSNGDIEGCFYGEPQNVAYIASEESLEVAVKPSLRAAGADLGRIYFPEVHMDGQRVPLLSAVDRDALIDEFRELGITIVILDPVMSSISARIDINKSNEVRPYIEPWGKVAEAIDGLGIGIAHMVKAPSGDIVAAINGSSAIGEVARSVLAFASDPQSDDELRIMSQHKNNGGVSGLALNYRIESTPVVTDDGQTSDIGRFVIVGPSERTVADVLAADAKHETLGKRSLEIIELARNAGQPIDADVVAHMCHMSRDDAGKYLRRIAKHGLLNKLSRGLYVYPRS